MRLIDSHCHIHLAEFDGDRSAVIDRALAAGVEHIIVVGNDHATNQVLIKQVAQLNHCSITLGIHPHHVSEWNEIVAGWLETMLHEHSIVAIGETGLDYFRNPHSPELQEQVMRAQIELAMKYNLPVVFHVRDAFLAAQRIIAEYTGLRFIMHCFTGTERDIEWIIALGGFISLSGIVTFAKATELQIIAQKIPADALLIETDAPFLAPEPMRGKRCEPAFLPATLQKLAQLRNIEPELLAEQVYHNTKRAFGFGDNAKLSVE
ncbi:MAG: TatD family hydrolase [Candidatus Abawacabacteria bacterium]|nr:TatD family hydrolase [Candidatus Abawacabacteria bacterium]